MFPYKSPNLYTSAPEILDFTNEPQQNIQDNLLVTQPQTQPQTQSIKGGNVPFIPAQVAQDKSKWTNNPDYVAPGEVQSAPATPELTDAERAKQAWEQLRGLYPKFDTDRAKRLQSVAKWNSIGDVMKAAFGGYIGAKGGPILNTTSDITPKALAEYEKMIAEDKEGKIKEKLMQLQNTWKYADMGVEERNRRAQIDWQKEQAKQRAAEHADDVNYRKETLAWYQQRQDDIEAEKAADRELRKQLAYDANLTRKQVAGINQAGATTRKAMGSGSGSTGKSTAITFVNTKTKRPDEISPESATAIAVHVKSMLDKGQNMGYTPAEITTLKAMLPKFFANGLSKAENQTLISMLYNSRTSRATSQFSKNDMEDAYGRTFGTNTTTTTPELPGEEEW